MGYTKWQIYIAIFFLTLFSACATTNQETNSATTITPQEASKVSSGENTNVTVKEFILGVGDTLEIDVYRQEDLQKTVTINPDGIITFPLVGDIQVAGMSLTKLRSILRERLSKYIVNPQVSINVTSVSSQKIFVLGEVNTPGVFTLDHPLTVLEAMASAGGFTTDAKLQSVLIIRGGLKNPELIMVNLENVIKGKEFTQNLTLKSGDIVYVPATTIANVSRFFDHLSRIISPIVTMETGYFIGQQIEGSRGRAAVSTR